MNSSALCVLCENPFLTCGEISAQIMKGSGQFVILLFFLPRVLNYLHSGMSVFDFHGFMDQ